MIISIANQKGGVGKTTLTVHLAWWLSHRHRKKVVIIDADPQANATSWLINDTQPGLQQLLVADKPLREVIIPPQHLPAWSVALLPGDSRTGDAMGWLLAQRKKFDTLSNLLAPLGRHADYVLIDTAPSKSSGFRELLYAADLLLCPTQLERHSLAGLRHMAHTCQELAHEHGRGPQLLGIVPNQARMYTIEHRAQLEALTATFKSTVWPIIQEATAIPTACSHGTTVFEQDPNHNVTKQLDLVGQRLLQNTGG